MQASTDDDCLMRHADETGMVDAQEEVDQVKTAMFLTGSFLSYPSIACAGLFLLYLYWSTPPLTQPFHTFRFHALPGRWRSKS